MDVIASNRFGERLEFTIDFRSGAATGPDATWLEGLVSVWDGGGRLLATQPVPADDPLHNPAHLAAMLATLDFDLPPDLEKLLPPIQSLPDGAIG